MLRLSSYSIISDRLPDGTYILMNGVSGALDLIDSELGSLLERAIADPSVNVAESISQEIRSTFEDRGHLTRLPHEKERAIVVRMAEAMHDHEVARPRFMIVPNLDCNYRCSYCFERPLQNGLKKIDAVISHHRNNVTLTEAKVLDIFNAIEKIQDQAKTRRGGQIILYGGEPLDRSNREVVAKIIKEGRERGHFFAVITNGHDLDAFIDLLGAGKIEQLQVSIDGPREIHDRRRVHIGHESSFDAIVSNIREVLRTTDAQVQIRVHVDPANIDSFDSVMRFFESEGWTNHPLVVIYANTVYAKGDDGKVIAGIENNVIDRMLQKWALKYGNVYTSAPAIHAMTAMRPAFEFGERFNLKGTYCSANSGNYIFAPDNKIYACWESVGKACSCVGTYDSESVTIDNAASEKWFSRSIAALPSCQDCAYALVCGGGCAQYAEYETGTLFDSYCDDFQRVFRSVLATNTQYYLKQLLK